MTLYGFGGDIIEDTVKEIHVWFDKWDTKVWYVTLYNGDGDSLSESATAHHKRDALTTALSMRDDVRRVQHCNPAVKKFTREGVYNG